MFFPVFLILALGAPASPREARVVSTSPQMTEIVYQLGLGETLVATAAHSLYPPEAARLPSIGGLFSASLEKTLALRPTHVLVDADSTPPGFVRSLERFRVPVTVLGLQSVTDMFQSGAAIAKQLDGNETASRWLKALECYRAIPARQRFTFLALAWAQPLVVYGRRTFFSDVLAALGGTSLAPPTRGRFPALSEEFAVASSPDLVFFPEAQLDTVRALSARWWPLRSPRLVPMNPDLFARASLTPLRNLGKLHPRWEGHGARCLQSL